MSLPTTVIIQGLIARTEVFSGKAKESGNDFTIHSAVIFGDQTMGKVQLNDDLAAVLKKGMTVALLCEVGVYRNDDQLQAVEWLDRPKAA